MSATPGQRDRILRLAGGIVGLAGLIASVIAINEYLIERGRPNIGGRWRLVVTIAESAFRPYRGLQVEYDIFLSQTGAHIAGRGEKVAEAGKSLPFGPARSQINLEGVLDNGRLRASYRLDGLRRPSSGQFDLTVHGRGDSLAGTFAGTAADSRGPVFAIRR